MKDFAGAGVYTDKNNTTMTETKDRILEILRAWAGKVFKMLKPDLKGILVDFEESIKSEYLPVPEHL